MKLVKKKKNKGHHFKQEGISITGYKNRLHLTTYPLLRIVKVFRLPGALDCAGALEWDLFCASVGLFGVYKSHAYAEQIPL